MCGQTFPSFRSSDNGVLADSGLALIQIMSAWVLELRKCRIPD
jgi:hypothetical protein